MNIEVGGVCGAKGFGKEKTSQPPVTGTQSLAGTESGLTRIGTAAKREPDLQFNNLYHHLTYELLHQAYFALKRKAAPGVDNMSCLD